MKFISKKYLFLVFLCNFFNLSIFAQGKGKVKKVLKQKKVKKNSCFSKRFSCGDIFAALVYNFEFAVRVAALKDGIVVNEWVKKN